MQTRTPPGTAVFATLRAAAGALLLLLAACADQATGPGVRPPPDAEGAVAALDCRADTRAGTLECAPSAGAGGASAVILGSQGVNVRLRATGMQSNGAGTFRMDVTVENLTGQALGTTDGATATPEGVRVFFFSGPTSSTGSVEVANPTGYEMFTAPSQPYFQYQGLLAPADTSEAVEWRFSVAPTVTSFQFQVLVHAAVARESGWLRVAPFLPELAVADSLKFTAQRYDAAGRPATAGPITWTIADSAIARVSADGTVTGVAPGATWLTAADGARSSSVQVIVRAATGDLAAPTAHELTLSPSYITANGVDSVTVTLRLRDGGTGARFFQVSLTSPSGVHSGICDSHSGVAGTPADSTFACRVAIPPHAEGGAWYVSFLWFEDWAENERAVGVEMLRQAGVPTTVYVNSPTPDLVPPTITGVAFTDSIEANGLDSATITLQVQDAGAGVAQASAWFRNPSGHDLAYCFAEGPLTGTRAAGTFVCKLAVPTGGQPGEWLLELVQARDLTGNTRDIRDAALDSAGFPRILRVTGPEVDTQPPTLTGFSFSPDTVAANGVDSVTITMELTDDESGGQRAEATFKSPSGQRVGCLGFSPVAPHPGAQEISCRVALAPGREPGDWKIEFLWLEDDNGNARVVTRANLETAGYPVTLTVTPP